MCPFELFVNNLSRMKAFRQSTMAIAYQVITHARANFYVPDTLSRENRDETKFSSMFLHSFGARTVRRFKIFAERFILEAQKRLSRLVPKEVKGSDESRPNNLVLANELVNILERKTRQVCKCFPSYAVLATLHSFRSNSNSLCALNGSQQHSKRKASRASELCGKN